MMNLSGRKDDVHESIHEEYEKTAKKRDEVRAKLRKLEEGEPKDSYEIMITRDRLAYWEGRAEGLRFALDFIEKTS